MEAKEKFAHYRLIETAQTELDLKGKGQSVYSALALYRENDYVTSHFVYDISRDKDKAEYLLSALNYIKPSENELCDFISELL